MTIDHGDLLRTQIGRQDIEESVERSPATIIKIKARLELGRML